MYRKYKINIKKLARKCKGIQNKQTRNHKIQIQNRTQRPQRIFQYNFSFTENKHNLFKKKMM